MAGGRGLILVNTAAPAIGRDRPSRGLPPSSVIRHHTPIKTNRRCARRKGSSMDGGTLALIVAVALLGAGVWLYNRLIEERNQVRQGFADIDVQLKRRADLVPRLVEAVRGYAAYEKALLTTVTELRSGAQQAAAPAERFDLERQFAGKLFSRNRGSYAIGLLIAALTVGAMIYHDTALPVMMTIGVVLALQLLLFAYLLPAYSVPGRRLQDHIEGLRYYLGVAEKDDLARLKAPGRTPQEFARFLPYALALDVEKTWADRFAAALGATALAAAVADYYVSDSGLGTVGRGPDFGGFTDSISGLGTTVSAAATPPGSSSGGSGGGGGGGSSGGGGGGGGGGGW